MGIEADIRAALETHLLALVLATTGTRDDIAAAADGYERAGGSFLADGFAVGDTVAAAGFAEAANNGHTIVVAVSDSLLAVDRPLSPEAAGADVAVTAGLPEARRFEGQPFVRPQRQPWVSVALQPRPAAPVSLDSLRRQGRFAVQAFQPAAGGAGLARLERLAGALVAHFRPGTLLARGAARVRLRAAWRGAVEEAGGTLRLPVAAEYLCDSAITTE